MQRYCPYLVIMILLATGPVFAVAPNGVDTVLPWSPISNHLWLAGSSRETTGPVGNLSKMERLEWRIGAVVAGGELCGYYSKAAKVSSFMAASPYFKKGISQSGRFDFATGCGSYEKALDNLIGRKKDWETYLAATYSSQDTSTASKEDRRQTAALAPPPEESIPIAEDDLLTDGNVKRVVMEFYNARKIRRTGSWAGSFRVSNMDEVVEITLNNISGTIATIDVEYVWSWRSRKSRKGTDHGVATIEKTGSTYRVLKFTTGGMTYKASAPEPVIVPADPPPPVIDAQTLMNDSGFLKSLTKATKYQYKIEIQRLDSVEVRSRSGNQARLILKYLWMNDNDSQRVGRGEATVRSIGGQFEVTDFKSLYPTPSQLLRADAGASGL